MADKFIELVHAVGLKWAVLIVAIGATGWYLGREVIPWVGRSINAVGIWGAPLATRYVEAKIRKLETEQLHHALKARIKKVEADRLEKSDANGEGR